MSGKILMGIGLLFVVYLVGPTVLDVLATLVSTYQQVTNR